MNIVRDINEIFPVDVEFLDIYQELLLSGQTFAKTQNIAILALARNIQAKAKYSLRKLRLLKEKFNEESRIYIYENDSLDQTPQIIKEIIDKPAYENFSILSEKIGTPSMPLSQSQIRTTNMANARNKCHSMVTNKHSVDFFLVIDIDFVDFSIEGLMNSFGWLATNNNIGAICGNSYINVSNKQYDRYHNYDSFAFRQNYWFRQDISYWFPFWQLPIGSCPITTFSGFGGSCIYRSKFYEPLYSGEDCEHVTLHKALKQKYNDFKLFYNPSQIMLVD